MYLQVLEDQMGAQCSDVPVLTLHRFVTCTQGGLKLRHSVTHPILRRLTPSRLFLKLPKVKRSCRASSMAGGRRSPIPNGIPGRDFGLEHIDMVKRVGYAHMRLPRIMALPVQTDHFPDSAIYPQVIGQQNACSVHAQCPAPNGAFERKAGRQNSVLYRLSLRRRVAVAFCAL